ncbi:MAG: tetratricopeptide repeat protein, partial [Rhodanobacteraceae bacterium]
DYCVALSERNARAAIEIAPSLGEPYAALGYAYGTKRRYIDARPMLEKAVTIDPTDVTAQFWLGTALIATGYTARGREQMDRTLALDPKLPNALSWRGLEYAFAGNLDEARRMLEEAVGLGLSYAEQNLAYVSHAEGNDAKAISGLAIGIRTFLAGFPAGANRILADGIYGTEVQRREAIAMIDDYLASKTAPIGGVVPYSLLMLGEPARALSVITPAPSSNDPLMLQPLWSPAGRAARKLEQFPEFVRATGLAELWDKYGMPDACQRKAPGNYVCE